jgi:hypothetical protein
MNFRLFSFGIVFVSLLLWCAAGLAQSRSVILSTTTSTQDSGLLDVLIPPFEKHSGYAVKTVASAADRRWHWRSASVHSNRCLNVDLREGNTVAAALNPDAIHVISAEDSH